MNDLERIGNNAKGIDLEQIMFEVFTNEEGLTELIIDLNTNEQLFEGFDSTGRSLVSIGGEYADSTKDRKRRKGQPINRVTLKDTGDFYRSFEVVVKNDSVVIKAATDVGEGYDLMQDWGVDLLGLTDESTGALVFELEPLIVEYLLDKLLA